MAPVDHHRPFSPNRTNPIALPPSLTESSQPPNRTTFLSLHYATQTNQPTARKAQPPISPLRTSSKQDNTSRASHHRTHLLSISHHSSRPVLLSQPTQFKIKKREISRQRKANQVAPQQLKEEPQGRVWISTESDYNRVTIWTE